MKQIVKKGMLAALLAALALAAGGAVAQPDIACSWDGQEGHVDRGRFGYEVWYCFAGEWRFSHTCNPDGTCNPIDP